MRPGFKGEFVRDIGTNDYNMLYYPKSARYMKILLSTVVSFFIIICSVACTLGLLLLKVYFDNIKLKPEFFISVIPSLINSIQVVIFKLIYDFVGKKFNFFENHKSNSSFEDSLIVKVFTFNFFNSLNSLFIIGFIKKIFPDIFGACIVPAVSKLSPDLYCYGEL
jgi:Calcium-activated chloride channel